MTAPSMRFDEQAAAAEAKEQWFVHPTSTGTCTCCFENVTARRAFVNGARWQSEQADLPEVVAIRLLGGLTDAEAARAHDLLKNGGCRIDQVVDQIMERRLRAYLDEAHA